MPINNVFCPNCGKLYNMDEYNKLKKAGRVRGDNVYDPRICSLCNTKFGFAKIIGKNGRKNIYQIDLDLFEGDTNQM